MSVSSVCVVTNALRLRRFRSHFGDAVHEDNMDQNKINQQEGESDMFGFGKQVTYTFKVEGMMCQKCRAHVEKALQAVNGVKSVDVDLDDGKVTVFAKASVTEKDLKKAVNDAGYNA